MAKGNPFLSTLRGRIGDVTFRQRNGVQVSAKLQPQVANPRSDAQMSQRTQLANIVNLYRVSARLMKKAFEDKKNSQSDYNRFVQLNLNGATRIFLTKDQAKNGITIVAPYEISRGSLPSITTTVSATEGIVTDISVPSDFTISPSTTIAALSTAIISSNGGWLNGDQLSLAEWQQLVNASSGQPNFARLILSEITLDNTDSASFTNSVMPNLTVITVGENKYLGLSATSGAGIAFLQSRKTTDALKVSSQKIVMVGDTWTTYASGDANEGAISSYGATEDAFLTPESATAANAVAASFKSATAGNTFGASYVATVSPLTNETIIGATDATATTICIEGENLANIELARITILAKVKDSSTAEWDTVSEFDADELFDINNAAYTTETQVQLKATSGYTPYAVQIQKITYGDTEWVVPNP